MSRTVRDSKLETRAARDRLPAQAKPFWRTLRPGELHLGYRRRRKDAPGSWCVRIYLGVGAVATGKSPYRVEALGGYADDYEDANSDTILSYAQAQSAALARGHATRGTRGPMTVGDTIADYIKYLRLEKRTGDDAERRARALISPELGAIKLDDLTTARLLQWRDVLAAKPARLRTMRGAPQNSREPTTDDAKRARRATVNRTASILKAALNRAFRHGLIDSDLAWRRLAPLKNTHAARPGHLSVAEAKRLINATDPDTGFRDLVRAALATGCRYGELCTLRVKDFHRGKIAIHHSKSGKPRDVVLNDEGVALFEQLTAGRAGDEIMLHRANGGAWQKSQQAPPMAEACRAAKITPPVGFHALRHTYASLCIMSGVPLLVVAHNLGHRDTSMIEKHYGHLTQSYIDKAIREGAPTFGFKAGKVVPLEKSAGR
jgi:integrase